MLTQKFRSFFQKQRIRLSAVLIGIVVALGVSYFWQWGLFAPPEETLYLALAGPLSGPNQANGLEMRRAVQLYLDEVNAQGGITGRMVRLRLYDDQDDPKVAATQAQALAADNQALLVLGHHTSQAAEAGGAIYKAQGIPAISGTATADTLTRTNPWFFRTIFDNSTQAAFLAHYVYRVLDYQAASIVYADDSYGQTLAAAFQRNFAALGGELTDRWSFASTKERERLVQQVSQELLQPPNRQPGILFLAMGAEDAREFVINLRRQQINYPIIGPEQLSTAAFAQSFSVHPEAPRKPGALTDRIYTAIPINFDIANAATKEFRDRFYAAYGVDPTWQAVTYYEAAQLAVYALEQAKVTNTVQTRSADRALIREQLLQLNTPERALKGLKGALYFDHQRSAAHTVYFSTLVQQKLIAAPIQLQPVSNLYRSNLQADLALGRMFSIEDQYVEKAIIAYTGMKLVEVSNLQLTDSTFVADFYLWFRSVGEVDVQMVEFMNAVDPITLGEPVEDALIDDLHYQLYRVKGKFQGQFTFYDYPFDQQSLHINLRHAQLTHDQLIYAVDVVGMRYAPERISQDILDEGVFDAIPNWQPQQIAFYHDTVSSQTTLGNPRYFASNFDIEFSRFNAAMLIQRNALSFILKNMLPVFFILLLSYVGFFLPAEQYATSLSFCVNALLSNSFFLLSLSNSLPAIGYTVAIEYAFYFVFMLALYGIILFILIMFAHKREDQARTQRLIWWGRVSYPLLLFIFIVSFGLYYGVIRLGGS